jgi:N-acetylglucosaminyldiphosphoundecaprenol N-acetyl-beta-D-mannosaminyltransferase
MHVHAVAAAETGETDAGTAFSDVEASRQNATRNTRARVLGCAIDRVDLEEALAYCEAVIAARGFAQHMAINVAKLVTMKRDEQLRASIEGCQLITADGQPIVWASRLLHDPVPCRVAGIDLMEHLLARAALKGYRVYILGATAEVLERAVLRMNTALPTLLLAGYHDGYYEDAEEAELAASIAAACPDILFVAMSSPRKEYFLARHGRAIGVPFVMGVGGAIDVYAGLVRRAPVLMQRLGREWLFRMLQEPRRLTKRYATTNALFLLMLSRELITRRRATYGMRLARRQSNAEANSTSTSLGAERAA